MVCPVLHDKVTIITGAAVDTPILRGALEQFGLDADAGYSSR